MRVFVSGVGGMLFVFGEGGQGVGMESMRARTPHPDDVLRIQIVSERDQELLVEGVPSEHSSLNLLLLGSPDVVQ